MRLEKILVAVDLSESAWSAAMVATSLTVKLKAKLIVLHVDEIRSYGFLGSDALSEYMVKMELARAKWMERLDAVLSELEVDYEILSASGVAHKEILRIAEANDVDLVVCGRFGALGVRRFFIGSTSKRLVRKSAVPVLVVPHVEEQPMFETPPPLRHLMATSDFSEDSERGVRWAYQLSRALECSLQLFHAADIPPAAIVPGEPPYWIPKIAIEELEQRSLVRLKEFVEAEKFDSVSYRCQASTVVAETIAEAAEAQNIDILVVPSHSRGVVEAFFVGSTTLRVLRLSRVPLLVLPRTLA
ncbi:MAG: hypothetical protein AUK47_23075 [Deltaproteobacteria bacterium CG2_30_63_29]|nr:MAG: hypothetical protein AUK47_23075 [Deltaproteobacteria bacterium CG2_30_63_29]PJB34815.1 MAG: hypothetical protein CO108_27225 [Deltaproteobacteria bacterium CG_4_9_14_3_um_filter_63_12]